jgi:ribonuclease R
MRDRRRLAGIVRARRPAADGRARLVLRPARWRAPTAPLLVPANRDAPDDGARVVAELLGGRHPGPPRYRLIDHLSDGLDPADDTRDIALEIGLRLEPSAAALALGRERAGRHPRIGEGAPPRRDLTHLPCVTIDPPDAADFDDAISWRPLAAGGSEVGIHIADVAFYVEPGDALDVEALERGTSVYLPGLVLPMLPPALSADAASLVPDAERAAVSVLVELDAARRPVRWHLERSLIRSRQRLTYDEVEEELTATPPRAAAEAVDAMGPADAAGGTVHDWRHIVAGAASVAAALRSRRLAAGGLHLEAPDHEVALDAAGRPVDIRQRTQGTAHALVEEHMLLANRLVGRWARDAGLPILFRIHERPRWERLLELRLVLEEMGLRVGDRDLSTPSVLAALIEEARGRGLADLASRAVLRALEKACYAAEDRGHYGLGLGGYCHFTSPIRRYPDLHTHRVLLAAADALGGADEAARRAPEAELRLRTVRTRFSVAQEPLAEQTSGRERDAQRAERLAIRVACLRLLEERLGAVVRGRVAEVTGAGLTVLLDGLPVEGWVARERLPADRYDLGRRGQSLEGRRGGQVFAIGQRLEVQVERVSVLERALELGIVGGARDADRP